MPQNSFNDKSTLIFFVLSGNKLLSEAMLTQRPDQCCHVASLGHNELSSHPSLGWLYVFSSCPRPRPPPQWLLLLTSKSFELDLRYLGQRKYRSWKMYFGWPWPKVMAVTLINKNLLVCRIKWQPLNQSLQNLVAISPWSWSSPDNILGELCWKQFFCQIFFENFRCVFSRSNTIEHISRMVGPIDVKRKGGALVWSLVNYVTLTFDLTHDLDLWFSRSNFKSAVSEELLSDWCEIKRKQIS